MMKPGMTVVENIVWYARSVRGVAHDARARWADAPDRFSPASLVKWAFTPVGLELPDDLLKLHDSGDHIVGSALRPGDLIFGTGHKNLFHKDRPRHGIGRVGIFTNMGTIIHASPLFGCVIEVSREMFIPSETEKFRGVRRLLADA